MQEEISSHPATQLLNTSPDDLATYFAARFEITPARIFEEKICVESPPVHTGSGIAAVIFEHALPQEVLFIAIFLYFAAIVFLFVWVVLAGRRLYRLRA